MRKTTWAIALAFVASLASYLPGSAAVSPAAAATGNPKVAIIVGATHGATTSYRTRANAAYAEAIKYSTNVVRVYSPDATWGAVKAAVQDASIVIYMGHGNGFPSPYRTTPWPYSQNGFGLNKVAGAGDDNVQYFGEQYIASEVDFAPNAVVLLHHLCYASGNSEPGQAEPSLAIAKQRADNYAAGFLKAGARAVIADGHMGAAYYIKGLFTTRQSIDQLWRAAPNFHDNDFSFPSVRSPGYTVQMDPESPTSGYYRAVTGNMDLHTVDVTGASYARTDADPAAGFSVPGAASVGPGTAGLFGDAELTPGADGLAPTTLDPNTRLRVVSSALTTLGVAVLEIQALDGSATGWMAAADLVPRDSSAPRVWESPGAATAFSPNADGRQDTLAFSARLSESASWRVRFWQGDVLWASATGTGSEISMTWNGKKDGATAPDGGYRWTIESSDGWGNVGDIRDGTVTIDTVAPTLASVSLAADATPIFSPNGDGTTDTVSVGWQTDERGAVDLTLTNQGGSAVRAIATSTSGGAGTTTWDGRSNGGSYVPDGLYSIRLAPRDLAGNVGAAETRQVAVFATLSKVTSSVIRFYPHDDDRFARATKLSFTLARPATVTWRLLNSAGTPVVTKYVDTPLAAGTHGFDWAGTDDAGVRLPRGTYSSVVTATDGAMTITQKTWVEMNAFTVRPSDTTPARKQSITVTAIAAESLKGYVNLRVTEPGRPFWQVRMTKVSGSTWKVTIRLRGTKTGTATFRVSGTDADGRWQATYLNLAVH